MRFPCDATTVVVRVDSTMGEVLQAVPPNHCLVEAVWKVLVGMLPGDGGVGVCPGPSKDRLRPAPPGIVGPCMGTETSTPTFDEVFAQSRKASVDLAQSRKAGHHLVSSSSDLEEALPARMR